MRTAILSLSVLSLALGGCVGSGPRSSPSEFTSAVPDAVKANRVASGIGPNSSAASWQLPIQLTPSYKRNGEDTVVAYVAQTGFVRGRPDVVARIGQPLPTIEGKNRTVQTCRNTVASKAVEIGGRDVEAVSAGPDHRDAQGHFEGPVLVRVTYANRDNTFQVVESSLLCTVDRHGGIVNAVAAEPSPAAVASSR
jgi:hypothetical protein